MSDDTLQDLAKIDLQELLSLTIPEITTASQKKETVGEAPGTVAVVTDDDIRARGYSNLVDVLRDLPGMETNEYYSAEIGTLVPVRGVVGNNKIVVMVNGVRLNPPGGQNMMLRHDLSVRQAKQIEIVYGPGSTMYGQDAIGAVINIVTKEPTDAHHAEAGVSGGFPATGEGWLAYRGRVGEARLSTYAQYFRSNLTDISQFDPPRYELYRRAAAPFGDTSFRRFDEGFNVFAKLEAGSTGLQVVYRRASLDSSEGFGSTFARLGDAVWTDSSLLVQGSSIVGAGKPVQLESRLLYSRFEIDPSTRSIFVNDDRTGWYLHNRQYGLDNAASLEEVFTVRGPWTGPFKLVMVGGLVGKYSSVLPKMTISDYYDSGRSIFDQQAYVEYRLEQDSPIIRMPTAHWLAYLGMAAYLELTATIVDRLRLVGGVRVDHDSRFDTVPISPRVAISYDLSSRLTVKYGFSTAYVAPSAYFYYSTWENHRQVSIPNPDIKPETSLSNEVNLIFRNRRMYASASAFFNKSSNLILASEGLEGPNIVRSRVWVGNDPSQMTAKPLTQSVNDGSSLVYGGELSLKYAIWKLKGWGSYSLVGQRREIEGQTTGLQQVSAHNFRLGLTYAILPNLLVTGAFVGRSRPANLAMGPEVDAHFVDQTRFPWEINLYALYTPWRCYDVFLNVRNLTNNRYALKAIYSEETGNAMVKEGIMAWAGLRYAFGQ